MISKQFFRFLATGGAAAAVNLVSRYFLNFFMSFEAAVAVSFLIGVSTAYALAKIFVFERSDQNVVTEFRRFMTVNLAALALVWPISVGLAIYIFPAIMFTWRPDDVAHFIGVMSPVAFSYLGHRHYTFKSAGVSRAS